METVLDLFQSKNLTSSIKDLEDIPSLVVTSKIRQYHTMPHFLQCVTQRWLQRRVTHCSGHVILRIVLQRREKYKTLLLVFATCGETFCRVPCCKEMPHAQFSSVTCLVTLQVAGNAARAFVRRGVRLKPPGTGYTGFDEGRREK